MKVLPLKTGITLTTEHLKITWRTKVYAAFQSTTSQSVLDKREFMDLDNK